MQREKSDRSAEKADIYHLKKEHAIDEYKDGSSINAISLKLKPLHKIAAKDQHKCGLTSIICMDTADARKNNETKSNGHV